MPVDPSIKQIKELLKQEYASKHQDAEIKVYRYNSGSIRIRIIDADFQGQSKAQRDRSIWKILEALPNDVRDEISLRLLLTPAERATSLLSAEFDRPSRSRL
jgi:stress-induced morphogen